MSHNRESMETVHLTIELLHRIPRESKITAPQLQRQLAAAGYERDLRSIQRHLKQITEHFDVECDDRGKPYGYRWKEKAKGLSLLGMSQQESLLLDLAEQHLASLLPSKLIPYMDSHFRQARSNLQNPSKATLEKRWLKKVRAASTYQSLLAPNVDDEIFKQISNALYNILWLNIVNRNAGGKETETRVMPLGLDQQVEELDDHYRITATVVDSAMLDRWLLGFGGDVWGVEKIGLSV